MSMIITSHHDMPDMQCNQLMAPPRVCKSIWAAADVVKMLKVQIMIMLLASVVGSQTVQVISPPSHSSLTC